jgi:hypothetical protein
MLRLSEQGRRIMEDLAQRYGVSDEAIMTLLRAVMEGNGTMAQFNHPELGGSGQWMQGGMTMVGDMFNYGLKSKVDGLCTELSNLLANQPPSFFMPASTQSQSQTQGGQPQGGYGEVSLFVPGGGADARHWWPSDLGVPAATGAQNNIRYAYFPAHHRLAVEINAQITVYDTQDHQIGGVSQQQSTDASLSFTSQHGLVRVADLPVVSGGGAAPQQGPAPRQSQPVGPEPPAHARGPQETSETDIFTKIERLAELKDKGLLSEDEFAAKKAELLSRL